MLTIRQTQITAFEKPIEKRFEKRMLAHLRMRFAARLSGKKDETILVAIQYGAEKAQGYGIVREYDIRRYLEHMVQHGPQFHLTDWAQPVLALRGDGRDKMDRIDAITVFQLRARAA